MTKADRAEELFKTGACCSQAVFGAFAEELGMDAETAMKVSAGLGGGVGRWGSSMARTRPLSIRKCRSFARNSRPNAAPLSAANCWRGLTPRPHKAGFPRPARLNTTKKGPAPKWSAWRRNSAQGFEAWPKRQATA